MIFRRGSIPKLLAVVWLMQAVAATTATSQEQRPKVDLDRLAAYIESARALWEVPGLAVAVVKDDKVVMARGFGVREVGKAAPVNEHTIFALSSMGKAFAAAAAGVMVDEGKLDWDDPVVEHLPWFQLADPWITRHVTVRDLLSHRGGIAGDVSWVATTAPRKEIVRRARYLTPVSSFRSRYNYSNVGITTAGLAVAAAAGVDWHTVMNERVLRPLRMDSSNTHLNDLWDSADIAPCYLCALDHPVGIEQSKHRNIVMPHVREDGEVRPIAWRTVDNIAPAGSINSNVVDMAQWLRMHLGKGMYDGRRFLSEAVVNEMHTPQIVIRPDELPIGPTLPEAEDRFHFWAYGLGWRMNDYRGQKMIWHTGGITGFYSIMALLPDANVGVVVLTNGWRGSPALLVYAIVLRLFDAYLGGPASDWATELLARSEAVGAQQDEGRRLFDASRIEGTSPSLPLDGYAGRYVHPLHDEIRLDVRDGRLILEFPGALEGALEHWHYDTFRVRWQSPSRTLSLATFSLDAQQRPVLTLQGYGEFRRLQE